MMVGIAVDTTVDSNEASADTRSSASVTARRRAGSKRGAGTASADMSAEQYSSLPAYLLHAAPHQRVRRCAWRGGSIPKAAAIRAAIVSDPISSTRPFGTPGPAARKVASSFGKAAR